MSEQAGAVPYVPRTLRQARTAGSQRVPLLLVGVMVFLGQELMFFAGLFAMYFTLRAINVHWPPVGYDIPLVRPTISTILLVLSSPTMQMAAHYGKKDNLPAMRRWIYLTMLLGSLFLAGQTIDYLDANFGIQSSAYGSAFYTMTGFHALHVFAGLIAMLVLLGRASAGVISKHNYATVDAVTYYWHFVDIVWIGLYATIFLIK